MSDDLNVLFCPQLRDIQVTVKEENQIREKKQEKKIAFMRLESSWKHTQHWKHNILYLRL